MIEPAGLILNHRDRHGICTSCSSSIPRITRMCSCCSWGGWIRGCFCFLADFRVTARSLP
ncbi:hypothetical protein BDA96_04G348000 [Sorghum bicolor]|uniref:Uncharacterized protein n=1 Tax=Sorghum bicolor TaxID=4558 RepID=A0A921UK73_SORBI|nr:hypothetical protein BDA96_04G348000 [Sorghum bicolor]